MSSDDSYVKALQIDKDIAVDYYQRSLTHKSEQMQFLESLLAKEAIKPKHIADICQTTREHLSERHFRARRPKSRGNKYCKEQRKSPERIARNREHLRIAASKRYL